MKKFNHYSGIIHIHTIFSKDSILAPLDLLYYTKKYNIDYVIITDHNTLEGKKYENFYDNTLLLVGEEITPEKGNHLLAFNIEKTILPNKDPQLMIDEVNKQNGLSFIEHPFFENSKLFKNENNMKWHDWNVKDFTGLSIFNYTCDGGERLTLFKYPIFYFFPGLDKDVPNFKTIKKWDELNLKGKFVGIGTLDVHFLYLNLLNFKIEIFPFKYFFNSIRTNIVTNKNLSKEVVYDELKRGHCYITHQYLGDSKNFDFRVLRGEESFIMGDELKLSKGEKIFIRSPKKGLIRLIHNGNLIKEKFGNELFFDIKEKGFYRVEIYKFHLYTFKPWIFSNPIYVY